MHSFRSMQFVERQFQSLDILLLVWLHAWKRLLCVVDYGAIREKFEAWSHPFQWKAGLFSVNCCLAVTIWLLVGCWHGLTFCCKIHASIKWLHISMEYAEQHAAISPVFIQAISSFIASMQIIVLGWSVMLGGYVTSAHCTLICWARRDNPVLFYKKHCPSCYLS